MSLSRLILVPALAACVASPALAQSDCTVAECAQRAAQSAFESKAAVAGLQNRISKLATDRKDNNQQVLEVDRNADAINYISIKKKEEKLMCEPGHFVCGLEYGRDFKIIDGNNRVVSARIQPVCCPLEPRQ